MLQRGVLLPVTGTVYGTVLNDQRSLERLGPVLERAPYKAKPQAPILYIKPRNTLALSGGTVYLPRDAKGVEIGATIGILISSQASRVPLDRVDDVIDGYITVADLSLPHESYYRPAIREKCFDGSCILGVASVPALRAHELSNLCIQTRINGVKAGQWNLSELVRSIPQLICDITEFMTLRRGDLLLVGVQWNAAVAGEGDHVVVSVDEIGSIEFDVEPYGNRGQK